MKNTIKILSLLLTFILVLSVFTACKEEETQQPKYLVTVQWMQGQKLIKEELVERGSTLTEWTPPEVEGATFVGWYQVPYTRPWRFKTEVTESVRIYAKYLYNDFIKPELPAWFLIGAGKGELSLSNNWNHTDSANNLGLFDEDEDGIYTIELSLYAGDQFKMDNDTSWDTGALDCTSVEGYDEKDRVVRDADGKVVFKAGDNENIVLAEGWNGKFEISYNSTTQKIGFRFIEELPPIPDDIRLNGDFHNNWSTDYDETEYKFTSEDDKIWTYVWEVTSENGAEFKVYNNSGGNWYPGGTDNNLQITTPGTYTVTFNIATGDIKVTDANGNEVDVGFTSGGTGDTGTTDQPNANPVSVVYVVLNDAWNDGSLIGSWTWVAGNDGTEWATIEATDEAKVYKVTLPTGVNMMNFVDFNEGTTEENWDAKREQTANLAVPDQSDDKIYYHVGAGVWTNSSETPATDNNGPALTEPVTVYFENNWLWTNVSCHYWGGEGFEDTEWPGAAMTKVGTRDGHDVYSIELPVGVTGFLFTGNKNTEPYELDQSPDISTSAISGANAWKMAWINEANAVESFTYDPDGSTPDDSDDDTTTATHEMYFIGTINSWNTAGLTEDYKLTRDENGVWTGTLTVTDGTELKLYNKLGTTDSEKWIAPATGGSGDDNNLALSAGTYHFKYTEGQYSFKWWADGESEPEEASDVYTVAGETDLCGVSWTPGATQNDMTYNEETGVWTKVFTNIAAGTYEYKVVFNHNWGPGEYPTSGNPNASVTVDVDGSTVTITWDPVNQNLEATVEAPAAE